MTINGTKSIMLKCSDCGKEVNYKLNLFKLNRCSKIEYTCSCGNTTCTITRKKDSKKDNVFSFYNGQIYFEISQHRLFVEEDILYSLDDSNFIFIGNKDNYDNTKENYFLKFNILTRAITKVYELKDNNKIQCSCPDSDIDIALRNDGILLKCSNCNNSEILSLKDEEDLNILLKRDKIILENHNISHINSLGIEE